MHFAVVTFRCIKLGEWRTAWLRNQPAETPAVVVDDSRISPIVETVLSLPRENLDNFHVLSVAGPCMRRKIDGAQRGET